jgi:hypothetical protein
MNEGPSPELSPARPHALRADAARLFLLGFLGLFFELALIRFLAGNIWNLGYFPNLVLIATFTGMGVGFVFHRLVSPEASSRVFLGALGVLAALIGFTAFAHPRMPGFERWLGEVGGELFFTDAPESSSSAATLGFLACFLAVVAFFAMLSQRTAKLFALFAPLRAYSLDIGGSCAGILAFMAVSWLELPAWSWFLGVAPCFLLAMEPGPPRRLGWVGAAFAGIALLASFPDRALLAGTGEPAHMNVRWSPYQKVEFAAFPGGRQAVFVNGILHQALHDLPGIRASFYEVPHERRARTGPPYRRVLVIGAGTGNDVAAALANGAEHVDAIEIDPAIARIGRLHHPARPYDDERVRLVVDDGRAFMTRARGPYDLVVFALTDSLVKVSPMAQLRLENYIFTEEAIARAFELLSQDGHLVFYNFYRRPWLLEKLVQTIERATHRPPLRLKASRDFWLLLVGPELRGAGPLSSAGARLDTPSDDWPFLYLEERGIPAVYAAAMLVVATFVAVLMALLQRFTGVLERGEGGLARLGLKLAFVLMGAAFLLLETKGVIQFSLLFGTTWVNNSLVFLAALLLVLAANATAARVLSPRAVPLCFALLLGSCALPLAYPLSNLLAYESVTLRFVLAALLTFSPIFFANLLFSLIFRDQPVAEHLFGWNLLGATLGGVVEYTSLWAGYTALAVVVMAFYALVFVLFTLARRLAPQASARASA